MIDPRALQQHFRKVQQSERPPKIDVPRVPDLEPLTAVQAIPEPVIEQEEVSIPAPDIFDSLKEEVKEEINLVIDAPAPIPPIVINEIEEELVEEVNEEDSYDPYGYYSGPVN
jgi:hypothetical protein